MSSLVVLNLQHTEEPDIMVVVAARTTEAVVVSNKAVPETSGVAATLVPIVAEEHHGVVVTASLPLPKILASTPIYSLPTLVFSYSEAT